MHACFLSDKIFLLSFYVRTVHFVSRYLVLDYLKRYNNLLLVLSNLRLETRITRILKLFVFLDSQESRVVYFWLAGLEPSLAKGSRV